MEPQPHPIKECLQSITLFLTFLSPHLVNNLPSILGLESSGFRVTCSLAALALIILIGNLYYMFSKAPDYFGPVGHTWGCATQCLNWVVVLTYVITTSLPHIQIFAFPMVAVLIVILFPIMEAVFWLFVGLGKEKAHLQIYGSIHDFIIVKWGNLLMVLVPGGLDCMKHIVESIAEWVVGVITAIRNCFPRQLPNQQLEEIADMENPPPYSSNFHTHHSVSSTSSDMTVTVQGAAAKI